MVICFFNFYYCRYKTKVTIRDYVISRKWRSCNNQKSKKPVAEQISSLITGLNKLLGKTIPPSSSA
jgi:hypothetical protein